MIIWSRADLDNWADAILKDFLADKYESFEPINIEALATDYLGLDIRYDSLSDNLDIYGVSAFQDTVIDLIINGNIKQLNVKADSIILEVALQCEELKTTRKFTLGHEAAHQILRRWERENVQVTHNLQPAVAFSRKNHGTILPQRDWHEWQANTLGAALIMPRRLIDECMFRLGCREKLTIYGRDSLDFSGRQFIENMKNFFGVSKTSIIIRLKQLGYVEYKPIQEYYEIMPIERMKWLLCQEQKQCSNLPKRTWK